MPNPRRKSPVPPYKKCNLCKALKSTGSAPGSTKEFYYDLQSGRPRSLCIPCMNLKWAANRWKSFCADCKMPKKTFSNKCCKSCNDLKGLRECTKCKNVLAIMLDFFLSKHNKCKTCLKEKREADRIRVNQRLKEQRARLKAAMLSESLNK